MDYSERKKCYVMRYEDGRDKHSRMSFINKLV